MPAVHKPTTRWMGMSLGWVGALNVAAALAPDGDAKKKLLVANGVGLLGGGEEKKATTTTFWFWSSKRNTFSIFLCLVDSVAYYLYL
jgi:hypothetical protein